jgi:hypothetical protein
LYKVAAPWGCVDLNALLSGTIYWPQKRGSFAQKDSEIHAVNF